MYMILYKGVITMMWQMINFYWKLIAFMGIGFIFVLWCLFALNVGYMVDDYNVRKRLEKEKENGEET